MNARILRHEFLDHLTTLRCFEIVVLGGDLDPASSDGKALIAAFRAAVDFVKDYPERFKALLSPGDTLEKDESIELAQEGYARVQELTGALSSEVLGFTPDPC